MIIKPDVDAFDRLLRRAEAGAYRVYTNTEQDVLDAEFYPSAGFLDSQTLIELTRHGDYWEMDQNCFCTDL